MFIRIAYKYPPVGNLVGLSIWTAVEPCMGVVGACIPSLRPLFALLIGKPFAARSKKGNSSALSTTFFSKNRNEEEDLTPISPLHEQEPSPAHSARGQNPWRSHDATVSGGNTKNARKDSSARRIGQTLDYEELEEPPPSGIRVKTEVILSRSDRLDYNDRLF